MTRLTRLHTVLGLAIGIAGFVSTGFSQQQGGTTTAPTAPGAPGTGSTNPGRGIPGNTNPNIPNPNDPNNPNNQINRFPDQQRPIFLSGKVMVDDGTPGDQAVIERVCNGNPRAEGYADSKGRFSFQLGQNQGVMQDASMSSAGGG